jgi:hypothetical protein
MVTLKLGYKRTSKWITDLLSNEAVKKSLPLSFASFTLPTLIVELEEHQTTIIAMCGRFLVVQS